MKNYLSPHCSKGVAGKISILFITTKRRTAMEIRGRIFVMGVIIMALALLPGLSVAGSIEPPSNATDTSGNPVPTMKTLDEVLPAWSQKLRADDGGPDGCNSSRFKCVLDDEAVLDKETGLVWERSPRTYAGQWYNAQWECHFHNTGGRSGWRAPTAQELESLIDYCANTDRYLSCGHPFTYSSQYGYWSTTTWFVYSDRAIYWSPYHYGGASANKNDEMCFWCVRGGFGINVNE
jgi:hypothetical protein